MDHTGTYSEKNNMKMILNLFHRITLGSIIIYYLVHISFLMAPKHPFTLPFSLFIATRAQEHLEENQGGHHQFHRTFIDFFHKKDSDVQHYVGKKLIKDGDIESAIKVYKDIIRYDKRNEDAYEELSRLLIKQNDDEGLSKVIQTYAAYFLPQQFNPIAKTFQFSNIDLHRFSRDISLLFDDSLSHEARFARFFYMIGLSYLYEDLRTAEKAWKIATMLEPNTSYYAVELASLYAHLMKNDNEAINVLRLCQQDTYARKHCEDILASEIPLPGTFKDQIFSP